MRWTAVVVLLGCSGSGGIDAGSADGGTDPDAGTDSAGEIDAGDPDWWMALEPPTCLPGDSREFTCDGIVDSGSDPAWEVFCFYAPTTDPPRLTQAGGGPGYCPDVPERCRCVPWNDDAHQCRENCVRTHCCAWACGPPPDDENACYAEQDACVENCLR